MNIPPKSWLIENIVSKGGLTYVFGPPGACKTTFMMYASLKASMGQNVMGFRVNKKIKVAWLDEELSKDGVHYKLKLISNGMQYKDGDKFEVFYDNYFNILNKGDVTLLEEFIADNNIDLVVIDSVAKVFPADEKDKAKVREVFANIKPVKDKTGCAFVILHHSRKVDIYDDVTLNDISGSHEFAAQCDDLISLQYKGEYNDKSRYKMMSHKPRYSKKMQSILFDLDSDDPDMEKCTELTLEYVGLHKDIVEQNKDQKVMKVVNIIVAYVKDINKEVYTSPELESIVRAKNEYTQWSFTQAKNKLVADKFFNKKKKGEFINVGYKKDWL